MTDAASAGVDGSARLSTPAIRTRGTASSSHPSWRTRDRRMKTRPIAQPTRRAWGRAEEAAAPAALAARLERPPTFESASKRHLVSVLEIAADREAARE